MKTLGKTRQEKAIIAANRVQGWMTIECLEWLYKTANSLPSSSLVIEVGSWVGRSSTAIALGLHPPQNFFCVDTWKGTESDDPRYFVTSEPAEEIFKKNLLKHTGRVPKMIVGDSAESAIKFQCRSVSFCFIDADHTYEAIRKDILAWLPRMKSNGIISRHDGHFGSVRKAVQEIFGNWHSMATKSIWQVQLH